MGATGLERLLTASRRVKALVDPDQSPTRSPLEDFFLAFCTKYGLPVPRLNVSLFGHEVDALFEEERLIVEIDSWRFHKDHQSFEADRERDATAIEYGFGTFRVTQTRLTRNPEREAKRLKRPWRAAAGKTVLHRSATFIGHHPGTYAPAAAVRLHRRRWDSDHAVRAARSSPRSSAPAPPAAAVVPSASSSASP